MTAARYVAAPFRRYAIGSRRLLVAAAGHPPCEITDSEAAVLDQCRLPGTIREHAQAAAAVFAVPSFALRWQLDELTGRGLLREWQPGPAPAARRDISALAIVTMDRPRLLERCLRSYVRHCQEWARRPEVLVVDDSRTETGAAANRAVLARLRTELGCRVRYVGADEKQRMRARLIANGLDRRIVTFALPIRPEGYAAGGNRNAVLLATAGRAVLSVDDDTECSPWSNPGVRLDGVEFWGHSDARRHRFFASRDDARPSAAVDADLMGAHERLLGQPLSALFAPAAGRAAVREPCEHVLEALSGHLPAARVRLTFAGLAGDSAVDCAYRLLFHSGDARAQMLSSEAIHRLALDSREVRRVVDCATVTHWSWCMTYCIGMDNTELLPPFSPRTYCEDGLFGALLAMCDPHAFFGHIPYGIVHDSERASSYGGDGQTSASCIRMWDVLLALLGRWHAPPTARESGDRLRAIGAYLAGLGDVSRSEFDDLLRTAVLERRCGDIAALDADLAAARRAPRYWRAEVRAYRDRFLASVARPGFFVPIEFSRSASAEDACRDVQAYVCDFGRLLSEWPDMVDAAKGVDQCDYCC
jgi:hypothetical protein